MPTSKEFLLQLNKHDKNATYWINQLGVKIRFQKGVLTLKAPSNGAFWFMKQYQKPISQACEEMGLKCDIRNETLLQKAG